MKLMNEFKIPIVGLANKIHHLDFKIDGEFFKNFENAPVEECDINISLEFDKRESFYHLKFFIDGTVQLPCDRCLEEYNQEIFGDYELFVKFSGNQVEDNADDDVIYIGRNDDFLDISKPVYDYILLSIPMRCVHPNDENGNSECNPEILKKIEQKEKENDVDPRWKALAKLKKNKN